MTQTFISTTEVADYLNVTPRRLRTWRLRGFGPNFVEVGESGRVKYCFDSVVAFADEWANRRPDRWIPTQNIVKRPKTRYPDFVRRASAMGTPFKYDIGFDKYSGDFEYEERARVYNERAQEF